MTSSADSRAPNAAKGSASPDADAFAAWRASVAAKLRGRPFDEVLVSRLLGGLRVEPLSTGGPRLEAARAEGAIAGAVHRSGEAAADGPAAAWWCGAPGALAASTRVRVVEGSDAPPPSDVTTYVIGGPSSVETLTAHERGASATTELTIAFSAALSGEVRSVAVAVGADVLTEIAKLRTLRAGLEGISRRRGRPPPVILARTSFRMSSRLDLETNAVRTSLASFAALVGGADVVCALPFDAAEPTESARARRLAWTSSMVLALESALGGPGDLARGSHTIEALSTSLGEAAWKEVRGLEALGDPARAAARLGELVTADAAERARSLAHRTTVVVGASRFPGPNVEAPRGPSHVLRAGLGPRDAAPFEALASAAGTRATLHALGDRSIEPRVAFTIEAAEIVGVRVERRGPHLDLSSALEAAVAPAALALVCTPDAALGTDAVALVRALRENGARAILVAGKPQAHEDTLRAAGATGFVHVGADVAAVLEAALNTARGAS